MRVLQLCHKPPLPAVDGGCIAMNNVTKGLLAAGHEVKILTIETQKHPFLSDQVPESYIHQTAIESVYVDTSINLMDAFSALVTSDSYNISRFFSPDFDIRLIRVLREKKYDIIHLESLFMTPYIHTIRRHSKAKIVLRSHNLEYMIWERMAKVSSNTAKKFYLNILAKQLKKYEMQILEQVDGIAAISKEDAKKYQSFKIRKPIVTIPFGIDLENYSFTGVNAEMPSLFHIGAMDWMPNKEGIDWFLKKVWPGIQKAYPELELHLAGRKMPDDYNDKRKKKVFVHGEVESAHCFMADHSIMVVPLLTAGGIRVKIIEALALGKVVVSTSIGAEGIDFKNEKQLIIADTPEDFLEAIQKLIGHPKTMRSISTHARELAETRYDNKVITEELVKFYQKIMEK